MQILRRPPDVTASGSSWNTKEKTPAGWHSTLCYAKPSIWPKMGSVSTVPVNGSVNNNANPPALLLPHPRVEVRGMGTVEGFRHRMPDQRPVNVFLGIPYAKPPVGELRFRKPVEPDPWHPSVLSTKRYKCRSVQMVGLFWDVVESRAGTSEDCLYLNVIGPGWASKEDPSRGFPVMLYIHGGAFLIDSAVKYHYKRVARMLVRHGVIVVTIQYRLGLLGYFCTGDSACPGNFGLWDQLAALKWTRANIGQFGGDPARITVFGQSAGAAATDLLALSPLSRDLFSGAILMGGNAECAWAVASKRQIVQFCRKWAQKLGFKTNSPLGDNEWSTAENQRMMDFLRSLPANKFVVNAMGMVDELFEKMGTLVLAPVVDGELVPASPKELRVHAPPRRVLAGVCKHEGMLFLAFALRRANAKLLAMFERQMQASWAEQIIDETAGHGITSASTILAQMYGISEAMRSNQQAIARTCVTFMSDFINNIALHNFCVHSLQSPDSSSTVFRFLFEHFNPDNTRALNPFFPFKGSTHSNELAYVFDVNMFVVPWRRTIADREVMAMVTKLWTNFAKYGDPNGIISTTDQEASPSSALPFIWTPIDPQNVDKHLCIAKEPRMVDTMGPDGRRIARMAPMYRRNIQ